MALFPCLTLPYLTLPCLALPYLTLPHLYRRWLLVSANTGEDIYGRPLDLVANLFLFFPGQTPQPWPPHTELCARLLRSGPVRHKEWFLDMSRASASPFGPSPPRLPAYELPSRSRASARLLESLAYRVCRPTYGVPTHARAGALGGRLRPFALAVVPPSECAPEFGVPALLASTMAALLATRLTVRVALGPNRLEGVPEEPTDPFG